MSFSDVLASSFPPLSRSLVPPFPLFFRLFSSCSSPSEAQQLFTFSDGKTVLGLISKCITPPRRHLGESFREPDYFAFLSAQEGTDACVVQSPKRVTEQQDEVCQMPTAHPSDTFLTQLPCPGYCSEVCRAASFAQVVDVLLPFSCFPFICNMLMLHSSTALA